MFNERRKERSDYKDIALQRWLSAVSRKNNLVGIVLADTTGLLVASSMSRDYSEEIAARAPVFREEGRSVGEAAGRPVMVREVKIDSDPLFLCAVGRDAESDIGLSVAEPGVRRILSNN